MLDVKDVKEMEGGVGLKEVEEGANERKKGEDGILIASNGPLSINSKSVTRGHTEKHAVEDVTKVAAALFPSPASTLASSVSELRDLLTHIPEMNLPWQDLRSVQRCSCGRPFTFLVSKV